MVLMSKMRELGGMHTMFAVLMAVGCIMPTMGRADENAELALSWHSKYADAWHQAAAEGKMLLIYFQAPPTDAGREKFESQVLADSGIQSRLARYALAKLPMDATVTSGGKVIRLLDHASFREMRKRPGIAIVDLQTKRDNLHGQVVSVFPFRAGQYYSKKRLSVALDLPEGTLTQRTMVFAIRMHPERPRSTEGDLSSILITEAERHSRHQAAIRNQGHHNWDNRFHRINARLPGGLIAQEVVAESWPGEDLVEACEECVHSWRQSPGHWSAVRGRHRFFGYDIKRGSNGIWYATGIFGRFR